MSRCCQRLGEDVGDVVVARNPGEVDHLLRNPVSNHVVLDVDVLGARVVDHVLSDAASPDVVDEGSDGEDNNGEQLCEKVSEVQTLSAAIGGRDVLGLGRRRRHSWLLGGDPVDQGSIDNTQHPENDFLSTMSCAQSESVTMVIFALSLGVLSAALSTKGVWMVVFR